MSNERSAHPRRRAEHLLLDRRGFLVAMAALGLSACSRSQERSYNLGQDAFLTVLNWPEYIDEADDGSLDYAGGTLDRMRADAGLSVTYQPDYGDTVSFDDVVAELSDVDGTPRWDLLILPNAQASQLITQGQAEPIPLELIPNHVNLDPVFMTNSWDRGSRFQMPWQAGITGIAYNRARVGREITSIQDLFDPAFQGNVGFITEMREAVGLAMLANGDDPSRPTAEGAEAAMTAITAAAEGGQIGAFDDVNMIDLLTSGSLDIAMAWSGDASRLPTSDFDFIVPDEGAIQWFDTMVIPKGSAAIAAAGRFMNFVYEPSNAAAITEWVQYITPVQGTQAVLAQGSSEANDLAQNEFIFPTDETRSRLYTWGVLDSQLEADLEARYGQLIDGT